MITYTKLDLELALKDIFGFYVYLNMKSNAPTPTICNYAAVKVIIDNWEVDDISVKILRRALTDLEYHGSFNFVSEEDNSNG